MSGERASFRRRQSLFRRVVLAVVLTFFALPLLAILTMAVASILFPALGGDWPADTRTAVVTLIVGSIIGSRRMARPRSAKRSNCRLNTSSPSWSFERK